MATRFKSVIAFLAAVMVVATAACVSEPPVPTSNIEATTEAGIGATIAIDHFKRAKTYFDLGEYDKGIEELNRVIQLDPKHTDAYNNRAFAYGELGQYQRAIQDYDKVIQIDPGDVLAYVSRGFLYGSLGQHERANQDLDKGIELDPNDARTYYNRGLSYYKLGQYTNADADKAKACSLDSKYCCRPSLKLWPRCGYTSHHWTHLDGRIKAF